MLINYVKVFQQSGIKWNVSQAMTNANQTGAGGAVSVISRGSGAVQDVRTLLWSVVGISGISFGVICSW